MASKPTPNPWPLIPSYWRVEVPWLLTSKGDFLGGRKRSTAAVAELSTLYEQLETAWDELTSKPSIARLGLLRQRAKRIQQSLNQEETDVIKELEQQFDGELLTEEKRLQRGRENLQKRKQNLAARKTNWPTKLVQMKSTSATELRTLRSESTVRQGKLKTSLATEWEQFETSAAGEKLSVVDLTEKQQQLQVQHCNLDQKKTNLQQRKLALPVMQQQIDADLSAQQQSSGTTSSLRESLKSRLSYYEELKAKLVEQGLLTATDFPTFTLPRH